jgi:hypothetical protein
MYINLTIFLNLKKKIQILAIKNLQKPALFFIQFFWLYTYVYIASQKRAGSIYLETGSLMFLTKQGTDLMGV